MMNVSCSTMFNVFVEKNYNKLYDPRNTQYNYSNLDLGLERIFKSKFDDATELGLQQDELGF